MYFSCHLTEYSKSHWSSLFLSSLFCFSTHMDWYRPIHFQGPIMFVFTQNVFPAVGHSDMNFSHLLSSSQIFYLTLTLFVLHTFICIVNRLPRPVVTGNVSLFLTQRILCAEDLVSISNPPTQWWSSCFIQTMGRKNNIQSFTSAWMLKWSDNSNPLAWWFVLFQQILFHSSSRNTTEGWLGQPTKS